MLNNGHSNPAGLVVKPKNVEALTEALDFYDFQIQIKLKNLQTMHIGK